MYKILPHCPSHGLGKIQKLPYSYWKDLKSITEDSEMVDFCRERWEYIKPFLGSVDYNKIINRNRINPSSFKFIYGILSSAILRAGGSNTMDWLYYTTDRSQKNDIAIQKVEASKDDLVFNPPNLDRGFHLSDVYLRLGHSYSDTIRNTAVTINEILCHNYPDVLHLSRDTDSYNQLCNDFIATYKPCYKNVLKEKKQISKLVTKIDFLLEKVGDNTIPIFIDASDLHGGLQMINDFNAVYQRFFDDQVLKENNESIVESFVDAYLSAFHAIKGCYPRKILICLNDEKRWNQDNGYNYTSIKEMFKRAISRYHRDCAVEITYMKQYIDSLIHFNQTGQLKVMVLNRSGSLRSDYFEDFELVVRNYMKLTFEQEKQDYFFSERLLTSDFKRKFIILEDERTRMFFDKRYVLCALGHAKDTNLLRNVCIIPKNLGYYSLKKIPPETICSKIIESAHENGIDEIVLKISDKSIFVDTTAYFFNLNNRKHHELLLYTVVKLANSVKDVEFISVEALMGQAFYNDRRVELRFLVFNKVLQSL
jgi:hypothetical protein